MDAGSESGMTEKVSFLRKQESMRAGHLGCRIESGMTGKGCGQVAALDRTIVVRCGDLTTHKSQIGGA